MTSGNAGRRGLLAFPVVPGCSRASPGQPRNTSQAAIPGVSPLTRSPAPSVPVPGRPRPSPGCRGHPRGRRPSGAVRGRPGSSRGAPGAPPSRRGRVAPQWGRRGSHSPRSSGGRRVFRTPCGAVFRIRPIADPSRSGHGRITRMAALPSGASRARLAPGWALTCGFAVGLGGLARGTRPVCADGGWCVRFAGPDPSWHGVGPLGVSGGKKTNAAIRGQREKNCRDNLDKMLREFRR